MSCSLNITGFCYLTKTASTTNKTAKIAYAKRRHRSVRFQPQILQWLWVSNHKGDRTIYIDTDYIAIHVLSTVAIQSVSLYSPGNGLYSDTFLSDFLC